VLAVGSRTFSISTGKLNLPHINTKMGEGYDLGRWNGAGGIESSAAGTYDTALDVELNSANSSQFIADTGRDFADGGRQSNLSDRR
jgi:hypothetical protein